ncbi:MAG: hypothetical protein ACKO58_04850 [Cyanobium sp.]
MFAAAIDRDLSDIRKDFWMLALGGLLAVLITTLVVALLTLLF